MSDFFKNTELAKSYNISEATVRNWIKYSKEGKIPLELIVRGNRTYVANSFNNIPIIENLIEQNRKYRNTLSVKTVNVGAKLLETFNEAQVYDIVRNLELHHEIPLQYTYFGKGASLWDAYTSKQANVDMPSMLKKTIELLGGHYGYIDKRLSKFEKVNIIDIAAGNALPARGLLTRLIGQGKLARYVAIDFSDDMLKIAEQNIRKWFGETVEFEGYQLDIAHERFANLLAEDYLKSEPKTVNLLLFLGSAPMNLRRPGDAFRTIAESMNPDDLLIYTDKLEPQNALPEWFVHNYGTKPTKIKILSRHKILLDILGIRESWYVPEVDFDLEAEQRYSRARLKYALRLKIDFDGGERLIRFEKGDYITVWRCWRSTVKSVERLMEDNGLRIFHSSQTEDHYILTISQVQADQPTRR